MKRMYSDCDNMLELLDRIHNDISFNMFSIEDRGDKFIKDVCNDTTNKMLWFSIRMKQILCVLDDECKTRVVNDE